MSNQSQPLDSLVMRALDERRVRAAEPRPWESVVGSTPTTSMPDKREPVRWLLAAASILLVVGVVAGLSTLRTNEDPATAELPPPPLEVVELDGVGATRSLSTIEQGDAVVPTQLFIGLALEPVMVFSSWNSQWSARSESGSTSNVTIDVMTAMDGEQLASPDLELSAGGADWTIASFSSGVHSAFTRFDRLAVFVSVTGVAVEDLETLLGGLRAAAPDAHPTSAFDAESGGVSVTQSASGEYEMDAAQVGEWLCWATRPTRSSSIQSGCATPGLAGDGAVLLDVSVDTTPVDPETTDASGPQQVTVFTAAIVPASAVGAEITHSGGNVEFAPAEDRSGDFDFDFVLGVRTFDNDADLTPGEVDELVSVDVEPIFEN